MNIIKKLKIQLEGMYNEFCDFYCTTCSTKQLIARILHGMAMFMAVLAVIGICLYSAFVIGMCIICIVLVSTEHFSIVILICAGSYITCKLSACIWNWISDNI